MQKPKLRSINSDMDISANVPRVCDVGLLHSYPLRCCKPSVMWSQSAARNT